MRDSTMFFLLECLVSLVQEAHVTRAADRLGMTQPKMSAILSRLRKLVEDPILVRTPDGMVATPVAIDLANETKRFLERWRTYVERAAEFNPHSSKRSFRIRTNDTVVYEILVAVMKRIRQLAPAISISVEPGGGTDFKSALSSGECDLALLWHPQLPEDLIKSRLAYFELVCIMAENHPRIGDKLTREEFLAESHVQLTTGTLGRPMFIEQELEKHIDEVGVTRNIAFYTPSILTLPGIVAGTDLLAIAPNWVADWGSTNFAIKALPIPFELEKHELAMVWHSRYKNDAGLKWLREILRETVEKRGINTP